MDLEHHAQSIRDIQGKAIHIIDMRFIREEQTTKLLNNMKVHQNIRKKRRQIYHFRSSKPLSLTD